jgi:hypothetical protein
MSIGSDMGISSSTINFESPDFTANDFSGDFSLDETQTIDSFEMPQIDTNVIDTSQLATASFSKETVSLDTDVSALDTSEAITQFPRDDATLTAGPINMIRNFGAENGNFTPEQSQEVDSALKSGVELVQEKKNELQNLDSNPDYLENFENCFGKATDKSVDHVYNMLDKSETILSNWSAEENGRFLYMGDKQYANIDRNDPMQFDVSQAFFAQSNKTQALTFVHESTHPDWNGYGTNHWDTRFTDEVKGTLGATGESTGKTRELAVNDPEYALNNADNYSDYVGPGCLPAPAGNNN